ncbi:DJ-1/PfpI family protein [Phenylobacterium sp.]|uniref:DJ-1/PfpI family protein n=1 Tax=Phenylobacterium sp. TaxID=1871053 RepID=UPI002600D693|nr:DJ-1/PfpI family protein [Phenylobacterium sp.]
MKRRLLWGVLAAPLLVALGLGGWIAALPPAPPAMAAAEVPAEETAATLAALKPVKRARPVVAVLGAGGETMTETTDYVMPYGILRRADVADVLALSTEPGPLKLYPALVAQPDATTAEFDRRYPQGADYVIVPAMGRDDDPAVMAWLRAQSAKGAKVIGVCAGAKVVAAAGLLDHRRATTHWFYRARLPKDHPGLTVVADRRFVVDRDVATTTGISASMPMMLTLIEAIGGRAKAQAVATELGVGSWDARHASAAFRFSRPFAATVVGNSVAVWNRETLGAPLSEGVDEVSLALAADAWSRTFRSRAVTYAANGKSITTRSGLKLRPDRVAASWPAAERIALDGRPAQVLDDTLSRIAGRYGVDTAALVATQLEYPKRPGVGRDVRTLAAAKAAREPS